MSVRAPFTPNQVASFNAYQKSGVGHPFTCGNDDPCLHFTLSDRVLVADIYALHCPSCSYLQDWMHKEMSDWSWRDMAQGFS